MSIKTTDPQPVSQVAIAQPVEYERTAAARRAQKALVLLRQACQDKGWASHEALAQFIGCSRAYVSAVLSGEKSCCLTFIAKLPGEVRERYACLVAEQYSFVVARELDREETLKRIAALMVALKPQMAKAELREKDERVAV